MDYELFNGRCNNCGETFSDCCCYVHQIENNKESQSHLVGNTPHFNKQCEKVFNLLISGRQLSVLTAITEEGIHSLPRRILDLKKKGVAISERWNDQTAPKTKVWFMSSQDIKTNKPHDHDRSRNNNQDSEIIIAKEGSG